MKRFVMSMDMFIYAESDEKAKELAQYIANQQQKKFDNQANVSSLKELNFGKLIPGQELI
jgi:cytochrome c553